MSMINSKLLESAIQYGDQQKIKESKRKKYKKKGIPCDKNNLHIRWTEIILPLARLQ